MSNNAPCITICVGTRGQILEGVDILNNLLDASPNPQNAQGKEPEPAELTPGQKAAATRKANAAKKKAEEESQAEKDTIAAINAQNTPATPSAPSAPNAPTTPAAPASPQLVPAAPASVDEPIDYAALSAEATQIHQKLAIAGRAQELVAALGSFNVQNLSALPQEQWGAFLAQIRAL